MKGYSSRKRKKKSILNYSWSLCNTKELNQRGAGSIYVSCLLSSRPLVFQVVREAEEHVSSLWFESILMVHVHLLLAVGLVCAADHSLIGTFLFLLETVAAL